MESIKHLLGICGEPHGLVYTLLTFGGASTLFAYIKFTDLAHTFRKLRYTSILIIFYI